MTIIEQMARAIADCGHIDLSVAIDKYGGIVAAVEANEGTGADYPRHERIAQARGVVMYARAALQPIIAHKHKTTSPDVLSFIRMLEEELG